MIAISDNHRIQPDGRCSSCKTPVVCVEDGELLIKSRVVKIDPKTGNIRYKCRECKKWLSSPHFKIVFDADVPVSQIS